jgi:hypothetical protein
MKLVFLQETINYMHKLDPNSLKQLEALGAPEMKDLVTKEEQTIRYYVYKIEDQDNEKIKV